MQEVGRLAHVASPRLTIYKSRTPFLVDSQGDELLVAKSKAGDIYVIVLVGLPTANVARWASSAARHHASLHADSRFLARSAQLRRSHAIVARDVHMARLAAEYLF